MRNSRGFTYIELIITMAILLVLLSISVLALSPRIGRADLIATRELLIADLSSQQLKSMQGLVDSDGNPEPWGVRFFPSRYVLFVGTTFQENDPENFESKLPANVTFNDIQLANGEVIFQRGSGEIEGYQPSIASVMMTDTTTGKAEQLEFNPLGLVEVVTP